MFVPDLSIKVVLMFCIVMIEPPHDKTNKITSATSEASDQPGHPPSLTRVVAVRSWVAKDPSFLHVDRGDSGQIGLMPRQV